MLHSTDPKILFLQEEDVIKAGALDMRMTLDAVEETYRMFGRGELLNPPKTHMEMPIGCNGDWASFFNTMPCYLGKDINIGGVKWAAEAKNNSNIPGIPYGIDITILSDPETVLPFCILDGTLITAMRTSAVAGVFAKYTAPKGCDSALLVGAGVIGRTMIMAICEALPGIKKIYLSDLDISKAEALKKEYEGVYDAEIIPVTDAKSASKETKLIVTETTSGKTFIDESWLKPGDTMINMGSYEADKGTVKSSDVIIVDYWDQVITSPTKAVSLLYKDGEITEDDVYNLSDVVLGKWQGRTDEKEIVNCSSLGLGALDIMIGYKVFLKAKEMGIGTEVKLWNKPLWE